MVEHLSHMCEALDSTLDTKRKGKERGINQINKNNQQRKVTRNIVTHLSCDIVAHILAMWWVTLLPFPHVHSFVRTQNRWLTKILHVYSAHNSQNMCELCSLVDDQNVCDLFVKSSIIQSQRDAAQCAMCTILFPGPFPPCKKLTGRPFSHEIPS